MGDNTKIIRKKTGRFAPWRSRCTHEDVPENGVPCQRCIGQSHGSDKNMPLYFLAKGDTPYKSVRTKKEYDKRFENWCTDCIFAKNDKLSKPCMDCEMMPKPAYVYMPTAYVDSKQLGLWCMRCVHAYSGHDEMPCEVCIKYYEEGTKPIYFEEPERR